MTTEARAVSRACLAIGVICAVAISGCAGRNGSPPQDTAKATPGTTQQQTGTVIDIDIAGGVVTPVNAEVSAVVGQPITLRVNSDTTDEVHVHSIPDHTFDVSAQRNQKFEFTVAVPGRVEVELHKLDRTIAIIQVRP